MQNNIKTKKPLINLTSGFRVSSSLWLIAQTTDLENVS